MDVNLGLLELKKSKIRNAGIGCFAKTTIPAGTIMGPYHGKYMTRRQRDRVADGTYIWKIHDDLFVDAKRFKRNNPLRYVNGAKTKLQKNKINCEVRFLGPDRSAHKVYYLTTKDVMPGEELIISCKIMACPIHRIKAFVGWTPEGKTLTVMVPWDVFPCECCDTMAAHDEHVPAGKRRWVDAWRRCERNLIGSRRACWEENPEDLYDVLMRYKTSRVVRGTVQN